MESVAARGHREPAPTVLAHFISPSKTNGPINRTEDFLMPKETAEPSERSNLLDYYRPVGIRAVLAAVSINPPKGPRERALEMRQHRDVPAVTLTRQLKFDLWHRDKYPFDWVSRIKGIGEEETGWAPDF